MKILAIDPSGNWNQKRGKGRTGFAVQFENQLIRTHEINGHNYDSKMKYWNAIFSYISFIDPEKVFCEEFVLYKHKAEQQSWDSMDTPRLLGVFEYLFYLKETDFILQQASLVKPRWTNEILLHKGIIIPYGNTKAFSLPDVKSRLSDHELDAIRHLMHGITFKK